MTMRRIAVVLIAMVAMGVLLAACDDNGEDGAGDTPTSEATPTTQPTPSASSTPVIFSEACQKTDAKQFSQPEQVIDPSKSYVATIKTAKGDIVVELFSDTPITTNNFAFLACKGFYDGLTFYRVEKVPAPFVIQGGDPQGNRTGRPGYTIADEDDPGHLMAVGIISMAKGPPNSTGSDFFITIGLGVGNDLSYLDAGFTVFGRVTQGLEIAQQQIAVGDVINTVTIEER